MNKGLLIAKINSNIVETQILDGQHQNKIITAIVDKEVCLTVEVRDNDDYDEYDSAIEVLGLATYSNSESTVLSYASIFDTLMDTSRVKGSIQYYLNFLTNVNKNFDR